MFGSYWGLPPRWTLSGIVDALHHPIAGPKGCDYKDNYKDARHALRVTRFALVLRTRKDMGRIFSMRSHRASQSISFEAPMREKHWQESSEDAPLVPKS